MSYYDDNMITHYTKVLSIYPVNIKREQLGDLLFTINIGDVPIYYLIDIERELDMLNTYYNVELRIVELRSRRSCDRVDDLLCIVATDEYYYYKEIYEDFTEMIKDYTIPLITGAGIGPRTPIS